MDNRFLRILRQKDGSFILLMSMILLLVLLPALGILVDYNNMRMFVTDVKNVQDVAGISCISHGTGDTKNIGAFDKSKCDKSIKSIFDINMSQGNEDKKIGKIDFSKRYNEKDGARLSGLTTRPPDGKSFSDGQFNVRAQGKYNAQKGGHEAGYYCPIILHKKVLDLLHISYENADWDSAGKCIKIYIPSTSFSATYKVNEGK